MRRYAWHPLALALVLVALGSGPAPSADAMRSANGLLGAADFPVCPTLLAKVGSKPLSQAAGFRFLRHDNVTGIVEPGPDKTSPQFCEFAGAANGHDSMGVPLVPQLQFAHSAGRLWNGLTPAKAFATWCRGPVSHSHGIFSRMGGFGWDGKGSDPFSYQLCTLSQGSFTSVWMHQSPLSETRTKAALIAVAALLRAAH